MEKLNFSKTERGRITYITSAMALFSSRTKRYQFGKCREPIVFVQAPNGNMLSEKQEVIVTSEHVFWCGAPAKFDQLF